MRILARWPDAVAAATGGGAHRVELRAVVLLHALRSDIRGERRRRVAPRLVVLAEVLERLLARHVARRLRLSGALRVRRRGARIVAVVPLQAPLPEVAVCDAAPDARLKLHEPPPPLRLLLRRLLLPARLACRARRVAVAHVRVGMVQRVSGQPNVPVLVHRELGDDQLLAQQRARGRVKDHLAVVRRQPARGAA